MKGKIVLVPFPFTDFSASKLRPALVLYEGDRDVVVAFISSKIPPQPTESDVIITKNHPEFPLTGLKVDSVMLWNLSFKECWSCPPIVLVR